MSASTVANTNPNEREINPMHLSLEQLNNLKTQNEEELQELQRQLEALHNAKSRFMNARNTLDDISTSVVNDVLLVPLNSSLYVPGKIVDPEKVRQRPLIFQLCLYTSSAHRSLLFSASLRFRLTTMISMK